MLAGRTSKGKPVFKVWQVCGNDHELISLGFSKEDHRDAIELFRQLATNELGERGPTEFYYQYRRLQEMHLMQIAPPESRYLTPSSHLARH